MAAELKERLLGAYPTEDLQLPDTEALWERGRRGRRRSRVVRSVVAVAASMAVVGGVAALIVSGVDGDGAPPFIAGTATIDVADLESTRVEELPVATDIGGGLIVGALDGMIAFHEPTTVAWRPTPEAKPGDPLYRIVGRGDRFVFYGGDTIYAMDGDVDADSEPIATAEDFAVFVPSDHPRRVWVQEGRTDGSPRRVWEADVNGRVTVEPVTAPAGNIVAGVRSGVVLQTTDGLAVFDPREQETTLRVDGVFPMGAAGDTLAWCVQECRAIQLTQVGSGTTRTVVEIDGDGSFQAYSGAISPDGRWLAAAVCDASRSRDPQPCGLAMVDLEKGRVRVLGFGTVASHTEGVSWTEHGDRVAVLLHGGYVGTLAPEGQFVRSDTSLDQERGGTLPLLEVAFVDGSVVSP